MAQEIKLAVRLEFAQAILFGGDALCYHASPQRVLTQLELPRSLMERGVRQEAREI